MNMQTAFTCGAFVLGTASLFGIQLTQARWTELQRRALSDIGRDGVEMMIEIPAGVATARHSHPGDDFGYVAEGTIVLQVDGNAPLTVKAGETFFTARGRVHNARNLGKTTARVVDTYIIDKGQPVVVPE